MNGAKRFLKIFIPITLCCTVICALFFWISGITMIMPDEPVILDYEYGGVSIHTQLKEADARKVCKMFGWRLLSRDCPSCGFSENASLSAGGRTYCIACDSCPIIQDLQAGKYFGISESQRGELEGILKPYGAAFPCV